MFTFCGKYFGLDSALCFQVFTGFSGVAVFLWLKGSIFQEVLGMVGPQWGSGAHLR